MGLLDVLTEDSYRHDVIAEGSRIVNKWEKVGLLEGLDSEIRRSHMARLLENEALDLQRTRRTHLGEASTMSAGDVEGFAAVAFPIVRRVFGRLIANELVSIQPMSLPSALIFFIDFQTNSARLGYGANDSVYGGQVVGSQVTGGVQLTDAGAEKSFYNLNQGYSSPTGNVKPPVITAVTSGTFGAGSGSSADLDKICRWDPDFTSGTTTVAVGKIAVSTLSQLDEANLVGLTILSGAGSGALGLGPGNPGHVRRLNQYSGSTTTHVYVVFADTNGTETAPGLMAWVTGAANRTGTFPIDDNFQAGGALGSVVGTTLWGLEADEGIPEIDIKVDSVSVTAETKKLKAKWSPELAQDINAYHNLDAEVELTGILSEHIALEIDREVIEDLVKQATAGVFYWSRRPGKFLDFQTGVDLTNNGVNLPDFTGNVSEWYETLMDVVNALSAQIQRKVRRGGATFIVTSPEVATIFEFTAGFRANVTSDVDRGDAGPYKYGSLNKKWDVYVDVYFPRNLLLVGRRGSGFLETGYVYAPYVPLQVTPTIFGPEDFVPRKGVLTRYAKKMVRPDFYGLVVVRDLLG